MIMSYLPSQDLYHVGVTSKRMGHASMIEELWKQISVPYSNIPVHILHNIIDMEVQYLEIPYCSIGRTCLLSPTTITNTNLRHMNMK